MMTGNQRLAMAVISQAVDDRSDLRIRVKLRHEAAMFLGSERSAFWCQIAGLDPAKFRQMINQPVSRANRAA